MAALASEPVYLCHGNTDDIEGTASLITPSISLIFNNLYDLRFDI